MIKNILLASFTFLLCFGAFAQKDVYFTITNKLGNDSFQFNLESSNNLGNKLNISRVDYYVSNFTIIHDTGKQIAVSKDSLILVTGHSNVIYKLGNYNVTNIEGIQFYIGVDSQFNHQDPSNWPVSHPLGPKSPSMNWGWNPGYRFVAMHGNGGDNLDKGYEIHGLWDYNFFSQTVNTNGLEKNGAIYINLNADYEQALRDIDVSQGLLDHGINATDLKMLQNFRDHVFTEGNSIPTVSIQSQKVDFPVTIYPVPSSGLVNLSFDAEKLNLKELNVFDCTGKLILNYSLLDRNQFEFILENKGLYNLQFTSVDGIISNKKILIQ
ncbi:MAG: MbnP family protein [Bacteroidia bacterium]